MDRIGNAFIVVFATTILLAAYAIKFATSPSRAWRMVAAALASTKVHKPRGVRSYIAILYDYLAFGRLSLHTRIDMERGAIRGIILEPVEPWLREQYRMIQHI